MKNEVKNLWDQARKDLEVAEKIFKIKEYYMTAFLCQQAIEKSLKALMVKEKEKLIKIHDIIILGRKVNLPQELSRECEKISRAYIESRYGDFLDSAPYKKFNKTNSSEYLKIAKEVISWAKKNI